MLEQAKSSDSHKMAIMACMEDKFPFIGAAPGYPPFFYIYCCIFEVLNLTLPLNTFQCALLRRLNVAPSQLHRNSWVMVRAFEVMCSILQHQTQRARVPLLLSNEVDREDWLGVVEQLVQVLLEHVSKIQGPFLQGQGNQCHWWQVTIDACWERGTSLPLLQEIGPHKVQVLRWVSNVFRGEGGQGYLGMIINLSWCMGHLIFTFGKRPSYCFEW